MSRLGASVKLKDVPSISIGKELRPQKGTAPKRRYSTSLRYRISYEIRAHFQAPHVIKFSGGATSGMLLFLMLENGLLNPERGDVVVFNNTSAEHPATYAFVKRCKQICENKYGVPFFWTEFQTYEEGQNGIRGRHPTYRLVRDVPKEEDPENGYQWRGEVFEESVAWKGFVPNLHSRICTESMKIFVSREFLKDWLAAKPRIRSIGNPWSKSRIDGDSLYEQHKHNGGSTPKEIYLKKKKVLDQRPTYRPEQKFADFSAAAARTPFTSDKCWWDVIGQKAVLTGDNCLEYPVFIGYRADELGRAARLRERNVSSNGNRPEGEHCYAPLIHLGVTKEDVNNFWKQQSFKLPFPSETNLSNCVFCFLKGKPNLINLLARQEEIDSELPAELRSVEGTPSDIRWWMQMEKKYARDLVAEKRDLKNQNGHTKPVIGFFGLSKENYRHLNKKSKEYLDGKKPLLQAAPSLPCDCTD